MFLSHFIKKTPQNDNYSCQNLPVPTYISEDVTSDLSTTYILNLTPTIQKSNLIIAILIYSVKLYYLYNLRTSIDNCLPLQQFKKINRCLKCHVQQTSGFCTN